MKVVFFVHCFFPNHFHGTETYTLELAKNYQALGIDVHVISAIPQGEAPAAELITHYNYDGLPITCIDKNKLPHNNLKETYYHAAMYPVLDKLLCNLKPDLVHITHLLNHSAILLKLLRDLKIPCYASFTDFFGICFNNKLHAADGRLCAGPSKSRSNCAACYMKDAGNSKLSYRLLKKIITPQQLQMLAKLINILRKWPLFSNSKINTLLEDLTVRPNILLPLYSNYKAAVAPTQFLLEAYRKNGFTQPMKKIEFGIDINRSAKPKRPQNHKPIIGFIGQIAQHKGVDILIEAFSRLPKGIAELHIYGQNDLKCPYIKKLHTQAKNHEVKFLGTFKKEKTADVFSSFDLCVLPSRWYENSPLVLLSALATHTPVLISNVAGMTEFVKENINGFIFERGSVDDLERVLINILRNPAALYELSLTTNYKKTSRMMAEDTLKIYDLKISTQPTNHILQAN